jgi:glycerol uptake facilitator-like aquaporin
MCRCSTNGVVAATNPNHVNDVAPSEEISMLECLSYVAARVIAGVMTALILAMIFNHQCNKAVQFTGAATASV